MENMHLLVFECFTRSGEELRVQRTIFYADVASSLFSDGPRRMKICSSFSSRTLPWWKIFSLDKKVKDSVSPIEFAHWRFQRIAAISLVSLDNDPIWAGSRVKWYFVLSQWLLQETKQGGARRDMEVIMGHHSQLQWYDAPSKRPLQPSTVLQSLCMCVLTMATCLQPNFHCQTSSRVIVRACSGNN